MRLVNIDDCNRELFYEQMGGKDSLITVETAFNMLMSLPVITEVKRDMGDECNTFDLTQCEKCQRYNSIEVHGRKGENTMTYVNCPKGDKVFEYIPSEKKNVRVDEN